jgi:hypothetical protein
MRNFILSAAVLAFAGLSAQAGTINNTYSFSAQDTTKKDTVQTPQDTSKKDAPKTELSYQYAAEQDTTTQAPAAEAAPQATATEEKTEVKLTDLPDPIKTTLSADIFKEWVPSASYLVKADNKEHYLIEVKKGEELRSIKIGADGKVVE